MRPAAAMAVGLAWLLAGCGQPAYQVFAVRVASAPATAGAATPAAAPPAAATKEAAGSARAEGGKLDLNRATAEELRRLPGISAAAIAAIAAGRPYTAKHQLLTRGVLSPGQYAIWKDELVVHRAAARPSRPAAEPRPGGRR